MLSVRGVETSAWTSLLGERLVNILMWSSKAPHIHTTRL